jgi:hypothetical protein
MSDDIFLLPDAGPLITLAYADSLDLLLIPGWQVRLVDRVLYKLTRNQTPASQRIANWAEQHELTVLTTDLFQRHRTALESGDAPPQKANLGE